MHPEFLCEVTVNAEATVIYLNSGDSSTVTYSATGTATASKTSNIDNVKQIGKTIGNELFIQLFKDQFFNDSFVIIEFVGEITINIITPSHKVEISTISVKIDKDNFPTEIIKKIADFFADYATTNKTDIIDILKLIGIYTGLPVDSVDNIVNPLNNSISMDNLSELFVSIMLNKNYINWINKYISNSGGINQLINNFIELPIQPNKSYQSNKYSFNPYVAIRELILLFVYCHLTPN